MKIKLYQINLDRDTERLAFLIMKGLRIRMDCGSLRPCMKVKYRVMILKIF